MSDDIPNPWKTAAERRGISPTYRPLASRAKVSHETMRRVIQGRPTKEVTLRKVADALGVDVEKIHEWRGEAPPDYGNVFEPDASASLLTTEERAVINSLIRLLTDDRREQREVGGPDDQAPNRQAGGSPVTDDLTTSGAQDMPEPDPAASQPPARSPQQSGQDE